MIIVEWAPKPYSNYQGPCVIRIRHALPLRATREARCEQRVEDKPSSGSKSVPCQALS